MSDATTEDCLRWYGLNAACERSGNVWLVDNKRRWGGPSPLFLELTRDDRRLVSGRYGRLEASAAQSLYRLMGRDVEPLDMPRKISADLGDSQIAAIKLSLGEPVSVITGGPGTGKTTITSILKQAHSSVIGISPTGKGADRLSEALSIPCFTIHRAMWKVFRGGLDLSNYDLMIIDEAGVLDTVALDILCRLLVLSRTEARIVFLGDPGQLPSVGPGRVLDELIQTLPTSVLDVVYRYSDAHIGQACESAKRGHLYEDRTDYYGLHTGDMHEAINQYDRMVFDHGELESRLITYHRDDSAYFNKQCLSRFRIKPIVCTKNSYSYGVFNGQCGYIERDWLRFRDNTIHKDSIQWKYSFGATCHGSQGGGWNGVVVWIPSARYISREWLLTACSRAVKSLCIVVRDPAMTERCLAGRKPASKRVSLLGALTRREIPWEF